MGLPQLETCCCVGSLRMGSILSGWWGTISGIITTIVYIWFIADPSKLVESKGEKTTDITIALVILGLAAILKALFSIALLIGISRERPSLFLPWIIYCTISLILDICSYIVIASHVHVYKLLVSFFFNCVFAYFILVVYSYYREIRKN